MEVPVMQAQNSTRAALVPRHAVVTARASPAFSLSPALTPAFSADHRPKAMYSRPHQSGTLSEIHHSSETQQKEANSKIFIFFEGDMF